MTPAMICGGEAGRGACPPPAATMIPAGQPAREMVG